VIAAGGGAFIDQSSRRLMLERCTVVWLDAEVETLAGRVAGNRQRPLLQHRDHQAALAELAEQRRPCYAEAHLRISAEPAIDEIVEKISAVLAARG
jgi:shikimate kinase